MKKIIFYYHSMHPSGGVERVISNLINNLSDEYEITLLVKDDGISFYKINSSVKIISLECPLKLNMNNRFKRIINTFKNLIISLFKLHHFLSNTNYDYIYTASPLGSFEVYYALKSGRDKIIVSEHASKDAYNSIYSYFKKIIYPKVKTIVVPTTLDTERYISENCRAIYIPHLSTFDVKQLTEIKKENIVLNVGRLTSDKQQNILVDIWHKLINEYKIKNWNLYIVGAGEEEENLLSKIREYNLDDTVKIIPPTKNIQSYYEKAKIFCFTSKMEGFGMVLLESMAFGTPCISFNCPSGPRGIIKDNENGFLIKCFDEYEYLQKLLLLINDPNLLMKFSKESLHTVEKWDNASIMKKWRDVFK